MSNELSPADKIEIAELFARYSHTVDHGETDAWVGLFAADGTFEIVGVTRLEGREQLRGMPAMLTDTGKGKWRHQLTDIVSDAADGGATAKAYGLVTDWGAGGKAVTFAEYEARLRRIGGEWRFAQMTARMATG